MSDLPSVPTKNQCSNCAFVYQTGSHFVCRRFPPVGSPVLPGGDAAWPIVGNDDWCGEWDATWVAPTRAGQPATPQPEPTQTTFVVTKQSG